MRTNDYTIHVIIRYTLALRHLGLYTHVNMSWNTWLKTSIVVGGVDNGI